MEQRNKLETITMVDLINRCRENVELKTVSDEELDRILKTSSDKIIAGYDLSKNNISHKDLSEFQFAGVIFPIDFEFKNFNFEEAKFTYVYFYNLEFDKCNLKSTTFERVTAGDTAFYCCDLTGSRWLYCDAKATSILRCDLTATDFYNVNFSESVFRRTNMEAVSFRDCIAKDADFVKNDLTGSVIINTSFGRSVFNDINYRDVSFINGDVKDARFIKCDFSRVYSIDNACNFEKAKLEDSKFVINSEKDITVEK